MHCETNVDECASNPCQNHGTCIDGVNGYACDCASTGYTGPECSEDVDECLTQKSICWASRICVNVPGSYKCVCPDGYCGHNCTIPDPCKEVSRLSPECWVASE